MEIAHIIHAGLPTVAAIAPIENKTSAGTPLATQKAPCQPIFLCNVAFCPTTLSERSAEIASTEEFALNLSPLFYKNPNTTPVLNNGIVHLGAAVKSVLSLN